MTTLTIAVVVCALVPALLFCWNLLLYREPPRLLDTGTQSVPVSVLIPARNEERSIRAAVESVLLSSGIAFEIIVLDDASTDRTAEIVRELALQDPRVRLESAAVLPAGWNGKQHACHLLAKRARYDLFCFLDADVRLAPDALARMTQFLYATQSQLVSGFPHEETGSPLEKLLIPLIHFVLLAYLPLAGMRHSRATGFAAGCGQVILLRANAYRASGGHAAIRTTMHDGLLLPRLFRQHGLRTDLADLTRLASCRMYRNAGEVWRGLAKNATEGLAAPARIVPFTLLLFLGQILPIVLAFSAHRSMRAFACGALAAGYLPRLMAAARFRQSWLSALLHPAGVAVLLGLQWYALACKLAGRRPTWKQRSYSAG